MFLNKDIVKEGNQILRNVSKEVQIPLLSSDLELLSGLHEYVVVSQIDDLVKKGQVTVEQGKELNEELKRNLKTKVQDAVNEHVNVTVVTNEEENILDKLDTLSEEELQAVKEKLDKIEREKNNNVSTEESVSEN